MDKIEKFLGRLTEKERGVLMRLLADVAELKLESYDIKPIKGYKGFYRLRKGSFRIIFERSFDATRGRLVSVGYRKDVYRDL